MKLMIFSIRDEDGICGQPFTQINEKLASVAVVQYIKKMPFMRIELLHIGDFDTKSGEVTGHTPVVLDYKKIFSDYQIELADSKDGFELSKDDLID